MAEADQSTFDRIGDAETVYMTHPDTAGVASSSGKAFKELWAPKGWTQTTKAAYEAHLEVLREQVSEFMASGDAEVPPEGGDAQNILNAESPGSARKPHAGSKEV